jgi:hypothetical protein
MGLGVWSEEGNTEDLSFFFTPQPEQKTAGESADTPGYLDETRYVKAYQKGAETPAPFNFFPILLLIGVLFAVGVIKL